MKKALVLFLALLLALLVHPAHADDPDQLGHLIEAVAFTNGDSVIISYVDVGEQFVIATYFSLEEYQAQEVFALGQPPETIILQACGAYLHVFVGYGHRTDHFIFEMPTTQPCLDNFKVYFPLLASP